MVMAPPPMGDSAVSPCFHGCLTFLHRHFHQNLLPHIPSVHVPAHLAPPGSPQAKQLRHLHAQLSLRQSCHRQKKSCAYAHAQGCFGSVRLFVTLWTVACQASLSGTGFSRQEYWSVWVNTGCHILPEHYISCCPSH